MSNEYLNIMKHKLTFIRTKGLFNCFSLLTIQLLTRIQRRQHWTYVYGLFCGYVSNIVLCTIYLGVWKIPCIQFPQRSQAALPDNIRVASTDSSALCHEQWVFINTGSSDGECDESLRLSNVDQCCLMQTLQLLCRRNHLTVTSYTWILSCCSFIISVETPFWPSWFQSSHWHSVASWWPKGHYGPQYRYFMEAIYCSLKSLVCLFYSFIVILTRIFCIFLIVGWLFFSFTDLVAQRGEKLELLIDKTDNLVDSVSLRLFTML